MRDLSSGSSGFRLDLLFAREEMQHASHHHSGLFEILLVEDDEADTRLLRLALEEATMLCRLNVVTSGAAALRYLRGAGKPDETVRPDLVLLDLCMTGEDAPAVLREVRDNEELCDIPVVLLTGMNADHAGGGHSSPGGRRIRKPSDRASFNRFVAAVEDICAGIV